MNDQNNIMENYPDKNYRIENGVTRGEQIEIMIDGKPLKAYEGESVAAAILATGKRSLRTTSVNHEPRGLYCSIGICFDHS